MQSVNDDMDDLFRKAAEDYPLNTDGANWDKLLQQMQQELPIVEKKENKSRYLWLLLLLPMFFICNKYTGTVDNGDQVSKNEITNKRVKHKSAVPLKTNEEENEVSTDLKKQRASESNVAPLAGGSSSIEHKDHTENKLNLLSSRYSDNYKPYQTKWQIGRLNQPSNNKHSDAKHVGRFTDKDKDIRSDETVVADISQPQEVTTAQTDKSETTEETLIKKDSSVTKTEFPKTTEATTAKKRKSNVKKGVLYYGFIGGADLSNVKSQKFDGVGYNFGAIVGYTFKERLSIESGVLWNKKNYYSKGQYFDAEKIGLPAHTELVSVEGYCNMYEIPVNIRYNILHSQAQDLFASAGLSSYLMNKESYCYEVQRYGVSYSGSKDYRRSTNNWFSVLNFSIGYQKKISSSAYIRIEPYFKLPINGLGIGNMSITSTGLNMGYTRTLK